MRFAPVLVLVGLLTGCVADPAAQRPDGVASACKGPRLLVAEDKGCVAVYRRGQPRADTLIVVLHGDVSGGGPANYHFRWVERIASEVPEAAVVGIVRPGYPDGFGNVSVGDNHHRRDHYTLPNMSIMASAIRALQAETGAGRVIAVGHSGGAATIANILALQPGLIDAAALLACPCNIALWRAGRQPWVRSVDPYAIATVVPAATRVVAFTDANDDNTTAPMVATYIDRLKAGGVAAEARVVRGQGHNDLETIWRSGLREWIASHARRAATS